MDRRTFVKWLTAGTAGQFVASQGFAASAPFRAVIVGGGMAGVTAAKYLRKWGGAGVSVTLVEPHATYVSNIMSNKVLTGQRTLGSLTYAYTTLVSAYGVRLVKASVASIDPAAGKVKCSDNTVLAYDRLILAPGIQFDYSTIPGMDAAAQALIPHAWQAGPQTTLLRNQLLAMTNGANFVLTIPKPPYRCPPGPYERACVVADWMRVNKPASKLIVLDGNASTGGDPYTAIQAEPVNFTNAFKNIHKNIEYHADVAITSVDATGKHLETSIGALNYGVLNIIPPQKAGAIITDSGLGLASSGGRWAGVNVLSYESNVIPRIHVIGDSHASKQPKAGHIGNQEAKVCADAILRLHNGLQPYDKPVTNSACYTPITATRATWLTGVFAYDPAAQNMAIVGGKATEPVEGPTTKSYEQMNTWFATLMKDTFA